MDKDVIIHVRGLQLIEEEGDEAPIEMVIPGQYYYKNGSHYLRYEEQMEEFPDKVSINYVKISEGAVEVRKKGLVNVHMVFEIGKKNLTYYTTPFGSMEMGIATTGIDVKEGNNKIEVEVHYALEMDGHYVADCILNLEAAA